MRKVLQRVSFSPIIYENRDFSVAIYDEDVRQVVQPGPVDLMVGNSSDSLPLTGQPKTVERRL